jgi:hypothetical protein
MIPMILAMRLWISASVFARTLKRGLIEHYRMFSATTGPKAKLLA